MRVEINQAEYVVGFPKHFLVQSDADLGREGRFVIKSANLVEYAGTLTKCPTPKNWSGHYYSGMFSEFDEPGTYTIAATFDGKTGRSRRFQLASACNVYLPVLRKCRHWLQLHRCGDGGAFWNATDEGSVVNGLIEYAKLRPDDTARLANIKTAIRKYMDFGRASGGGHSWQCEQSSRTRASLTGRIRRPPLPGCRSPRAAPLPGCTEVD